MIYDGINMMRFKIALIGHYVCMKTINAPDHD